MIRLGLKEYVRNVWMNLLSVVMLTVMMVSVMILVTTILKQTRLYRLVLPYLGEKGIVADHINKEYMDKLKAVDRILVSEEGSADITAGGKTTLMPMCIYDGSMEKYLEPVMKEGTWIDNDDSYGGSIAAVISENNLGIGAGDKVKVTLTTKEGKYTTALFYITGVFCDGQKIYTAELDIERDSDYRDYFTTYSFGQGGEMKLITTKEQLGSYYEKIDLVYGAAFIKYNDDITDMQMKYNKMILKKACKDIIGISGLVNSYQTTSELHRISKRSIKNLCMTYIPLIVADLVLVSICILGIVAVETARSMGYYGKLYLCGMTWKHSIRLSGMEMCLNSIFAVILAVVMTFIQNRYNVLGRMYIETGREQLLCMSVMCIITIGLSVLMSRMIINEKTPVEIIRQSKH